jgi:hypothetical protein
MTTRFFALAFAAGLAASSAIAQDDAGDRVNMVIVYGDDAAPQPVGDEIVVVARLPESERFRIPEGLRYSDDPANNSWVRRVERMEFIGDFGTLSCSTVGVGGSTGCTQEMIRQAYADRNASASVRFGQLIAAAREERLATIDDDAADEQARVEEIEREYMRRLEGERDAPVGDEAEIIATTPDSESLTTPPQD